MKRKVDLEPWSNFSSTVKKQRSIPTLLHRLIYFPKLNNLFFQCFPFFELYSLTQLDKQTKDELLSEMEQIRCPTRTMNFFVFCDTGVVFRHLVDLSLSFGGSFAQALTLTKKSFPRLERLELANFKLQQSLFIDSSIHLTKLHLSNYGLNGCAVSFNPCKLVDLDVYVQTCMDPTIPSFLDYLTSSSSLVSLTLGGHIPAEFFTQILPTFKSLRHFGLDSAKIAHLEKIRIQNEGLESLKLVLFSPQKPAKRIEISYSKQLKRLNLHHCAPLFLDQEEFFSFPELEELTLIDRDSSLNNFVQHLSANSMPELHSLFIIAYLQVVKLDWNFLLFPKLKSLTLEQFGDFLLQHTFELGNHPSIETIKVFAKSTRLNNLPSLKSLKNEAESTHLHQLPSLNELHLRAEGPVNIQTGEPWSWSHIQKLNATLFDHLASIIDEMSLLVCLHLNIVPIYPSRPDDVTLAAFLPHLAGLPRLEELSINDTSPNEADLIFEGFPRLRSLKFINSWNRSIHLQNLPNLLRFTFIHKKKNCLLSCSSLSKFLTLDLSELELHFKTRSCILTLQLLDLPVLSQIIWPHVKNARSNLIQLEVKDNVRMCSTLETALQKRQQQQQQQQQQDE